MAMAKAAPMTTSQSGTRGGRTRAKSIPVTMALPSMTNSLFLSSLETYSVRIAVTTETRTTKSE